NQAAHAFGTGQGACQGDTRIDAGTVVEIDGVGKRASGKYYVTATLHHYEPRGYTTFFDYMRPGDSPTPAAAKKSEPAPAPAPDKAAEGPVEDDNVLDLKLTDDQGRPLANEKYKVTLPDGKVVEGKLDMAGRLRLVSKVKGDAQVTFPDLDVNKRAVTH
ncbi:MAG TPA: hypothetical protein VFF73_21055, partial [Planctomycetota bacterium]|nr:hypothetical protein [Planctomycetota bacterium]